MVVEERQETLAAMKERSKMEELAGGVAVEIMEIEWPKFGKVLGTTGVILAVITDFNIVLLTVNAIPAELSDRVFVGNRRFLAKTGIGLFVGRKEVWGNFLFTVHYTTVRLSKLIK
ncbi:Preprotein translocase subunit SECE1 [Platanthera guangdongensis]|uniref:Preprotein translocase subunit SECE1 n=1 Tax=Platanthera guangdongensis TaxID=2320717 RepID=A0ABR2N4L0_9ASPA